VSEFREFFMGYLGKRLEVRGRLDAVRSDGKGRRACVQQPEVEGEVACGYVWVLNVGPEWEGLEGSEIKFTALVHRYDSADGQNFGLRSPDAPQVLTPPVFRVPALAAAVNGTAVDHAPPRTAARLDAALREPEPEPEATPRDRDGVADFRAARAFAKVAGGPQKALEVLKALPDGFPVAVMRAYLEAMIEV
jgi:hypothetical protein